MHRTQEAKTEAQQIQQWDTAVVDLTSALQAITTAVGNTAGPVAAIAATLRGQEHALHDSVKASTTAAAALAVATAHQHAKAAAICADIQVGRCICVCWRHAGLPN